MAGRHYNWHKRWRRDPMQLHLIHESGLLARVGESYVVLSNENPFREHQMTLGKPKHVIDAMLKRLEAEARMWRDPTTPN